MAKLGKDSIKWQIIRHLDTEYNRLLRARRKPLRLQLLLQQRLLQALLQRRSASPARPYCYQTQEQPTTKPAAAEQPVEQLTGGVGSDAVKNLVQSGISKRLRAILGDTMADVVDRTLTFGKKLWNSFVDPNLVGHVKNHERDYKTDHQVFDRRPA